MNRRRAAEAFALFLLAALPGCGQRAGSTAAAQSALYPGADASAKTEHVFLYPLDEALAAAQEVLESHDFDVEPFKDETQLMTRWRPVGRQTGAGASYVGTYQLRRYYIQGQALSPKHSVIRVFRIDREEEYRPGEMDSELSRTAERARVRGSGTGSGSGRGVGDWQNWVAAGVESERIERTRDETREEGNPRQGEEGAGRFSSSSKLLPPGATQRSLQRNANLGGQYDMPTGDELRGRNERGVRDRIFEKELVERLEQFASLEFTGGGVDVPPPPAPAGAPAHTTLWELESGGMPFLKGSPCGEPVRGVEALAAPGATVLVGEPLGTREVPSAVGNLTCQLTEQGRSVVLGLSIPREEQEALDAYLASSGTRADQDALLAGAFWRQAPRDGRSSRALLVLIERVRSWRAAGKSVQLLAYDARGLKGTERESAVAKLLLERRQAAPDATLLVLGGNYHVRVDGSVLPWSRSFKPFGHQLKKAGVKVTSLDTAFTRGTRWTCTVNRHVEAECRVYATTPTEQTYSAPGKALGVELFAQESGDGFHGLLHVGALSASAPALLPRTALAAATR